MKNIKQSLLTGAILTALIPHIQAEDSPIYTLPEVITSATRTATSIDRTASAISVITREELEAKRIHSLADALESLPSVSLARNGTPGQVTSIFTRGTESNHTLLTFDGRRVAANLAGGFDYANLSLDNVERIEVVRSPSSSLYGADAIGGVINIITRTGRGLEQPEYGISLEAGSFTTTRANLQARGASKGFDYAFSVSHLNTDYPRPNNRYRKGAVRSSLGYEISEHAYVDLKLSYYSSRAGTPGSTAFPSMTDFVEFDVLDLSPGLHLELGNYKGRLFYTHNNQVQPSSIFGAPNRINQNAHQVDWQNDLEITDSWTLSAGLFAQSLDVERSTFGVNNINQDFSWVGGFFQSQFTPFERLTLINSVRHDGYSDYDSATTWKNGLSVRIPGSETILYANVSKSYAPPTPQDLYFPFGSNPNLRPEKALSWEVGLDQSLLEDQLELGVAGFHNKYRDFIELDGFFVPQNIPDAKTYGIESHVRWSPIDQVIAKASYTYTHAVDETNNRRLIRRARHLAKADLFWRPLAPLTLASGIIFAIDRQDAAFPPPFFTRTNADLEDYITLHATINYKVTDNFTLWLRSENLNDEEYDSVTGFPALERAIYGGMQLTF